MKGWLYNAWETVNKVLDEVPEEEKHEGHRQGQGEFSEEEVALGVTRETVEFVEELVCHPMTWIQFPLDVLAEEEGLSDWDQDWKSTSTSEEEDETEMETVKRLPMPLLLTKPQERHVELMLKRCEELGRLRYRLVPTAMEDDVFWRIYFTLARQHLEALERGTPAMSERKSHALGASSTETIPQLQPVRASWSDVDLDQVSRADEHLRMAVAHLGIPENLRSRVWSELLQCEQQPEYEARKLSVYGKHGVPERSFACPSFGAAENIVPASEVLKRVLTVLCVYDCQCRQEPCPQLLPLANALVPRFSESHMYGMLRSLLLSSLDADNITACSGGMLWASPRHATFGCAVFELVLREELPSVYSRMLHLGVRASEVCLPWFQSLFQTILPSDAEKMVMLDRYLMDGSSALYRGALAIFFMHKGTLTNCETKKEFKTSLRTLIPRHADTIISTMPMFSWNLEDLLEDAAGPLNKSRTEVPPRDGGCALFSRVLVNEPSECASAFLWEMLWEWLPLRFRVSTSPTRIYSTTSHGFSLRTMRSRAKEFEPPFVLFCKTIGESVIGSFITDTLAAAEGKTKGNGEMFVFQDSTQVYKWHDGSCEERVFLVCKQNQMSVGGAALWLDESLENGSTTASATFNSPPLCHPPSFEVMCVELWKI